MVLANPTDGVETEAKSPGGALVVLLVDDDAKFRADLHEMLAGRGYRVLEASTGDEALDIMTDERVNVMVTDLVMPGLNGFELLRIARQRNTSPAFRTIAITGQRKIDEAMRDMLNSLGAQVTLQKPVTAEALVQAITD